MTTVKRERGLASMAGRGAVVTMGGQLLRIVIQLAGIVLLARLLSPSDYGITAMVLAIVGVGEILRDFGLSSAAIQAKTITAGQRANLFWINVGIGAALTAAVAALAHPIAAFYSDPRLVLVTVALSLTFVLNGFATQFRADLNRRLRFGQLAAVEVGAQATALVIALMLAVWGWGYWALVAQQVLQVLFQALALPLLGGWWPGLPKRGEKMRPFLTFGGGLAASQLLNYASRNIDSVIIGRLFGASALGFYNRAFQLMLLPLNQINAPSMRVALPTLSRLQDEPKRYAEFLLFGQTVQLNVVSFVLAFCAAQAAPIVAIALGPQWSPSVPLFQILAIAGFFQAAAYASYWVFLSQGLTSALFWYTVDDPTDRDRSASARRAVGRRGRRVDVRRVRRDSLAGRLHLARGGRRRRWGGSSGTGCASSSVYAVAAGVSVASTLWLPADDAIVRLLVGFAAFVTAIALIALIFPPLRRDLSEIAAARRFLRRTPETRPDIADATSGETP